MLPVSWTSRGKVQHIIFAIVVRTSLTSLLCSTATFLSPSHAVTLGNAEISFNVLQQWFNHTTGLWIPSTGWWNSANCLTTIADLALIDSKVRVSASYIWPTTWTKAQLYNLQMQRTVTSHHLPWTYYGPGPGQSWPHLPPTWPLPPWRQTNGFLNDYYDDEGWWALAWIAVYDVTGNRQYLETAESIFDDMAKSFNTTPCGGIWWDKAHTYVNAIANELFLDVAAHLANRVGGGMRQYYLDWAERQWNWFDASGMINSKYTINDGLTGDCKNNGGTVWSYNQGVILGGLTELSKATGDKFYITIAKKIADAAIATLTDAKGILHDAYAAAGESRTAVQGLPDQQREQNLDVRP
ncbi:hypothetical protein B0A48_02567 [Cryoendolithus antarcticus]|uniref:Mannan endo-1,6-alpha-mannosidase n=1 Tax=Cryoendolithus antarcticus TaxID=1507870 RepID=A0A1V8TNZ2_9PEZI|nr:hypothetical protein B0A48_02567 [Cryoendolithus antarcticus]